MKLTDRIQYTNQDCMELMAQYPDKYFDIAIVDPPYGISQDGHRDNNRSKAAKSKKYHKALWDQGRPTPEYFKELGRVSKNVIIWGGNHLADVICQAFDASPCWIVWDKHTTGGFADCELAYTSYKTAVRKFDYPWNGMIQGNHGTKTENEERIHPTQKPVMLYRWLLDKYAYDGDKILDTHGGSLSSGIACHYSGFELVACEIDPVYYKQSVERFRLQTKQLKAF